MSLAVRSRPRGLGELVFANQTLQTAILRMGNPKLAKNLLLHGQSGSGKSATCQVLAKHLVGDQHSSDIRTINVSLQTSKTALEKAINSFNGMSGLNQVGKVIFILEELDGADLQAQQALKGILDDNEKSALFFATTNHIGKIIEPLENRFVTHHMPRPDEEAWSQRACEILAREHVRVTPSIAANLLRNCSKGGSARDFINTLDVFADIVKQANMVRD